jgi:hypothetical protein
MWLWTLGFSSDDLRLSIEEEQEPEGSDNGEQSKIVNQKSQIYSLEYDAARKIAQGLGAHLEQLSNMVEVKGETARLLPVAERTRFLFGKDEAQAPATKRKKKDPQLQLDFMHALEQEEDDGWGKKGAPALGVTTLDRIHQTMILFAAGRAEAMKRFLVEEGAGKDPRFWRLAQALSALYPAHTDEKRWVDSVLARKKGLGF